MFNDLPGESISFSEMMLHLTSTNHVSLPDGLGEEELLELGPIFQGCQFIDRIIREEADEEGPDLLIFMSIIGCPPYVEASHHPSSHFDHLPATLSPILSDMFELGANSCFHHPNHALIMPAPPPDPGHAPDIMDDGEKIAMPGSYNQVSLHRTLTGWVAQLQDPEVNELGDSSSTVDVSQSYTPPGLPLLAHAINHVSASHHPPPFEAISYPSYSPTPSNTPTISTTCQLYQGIFGSNSFQFQTSSWPSDESIF
ncbi:hypothetical protein PISMIDRAFT_10095 [Pisolithus microcarpus 441]|uniref:Unplaced genomic scaffold scaffold_30, whole genome shotgun sequence n=1 Tax=Pisolithus microcarpus 441 TaxID=765257 RepID=A0A0C9YI00_9AGAM|nr:hypothetical protein PISMIDRAFT_10095 [Pisolithus microcarpus 441]